MVLWIGVDDTDSLRGMCTTFLATELVRALSAEFDIIGFPRLVRLNPNVPWKTRGNGAVCLRVGRGDGKPFVIGEMGNGHVLGYPGATSEVSAQRVSEIVADLVEQWASFEDPTTQPAFVVLRKRPSPALYWKAVRELVSVGETLEAIRGRGLARLYKGGRGVVGASAAVAWRPRDRTWEIMAYRERPRWGSRRELDPVSVKEMDRSFPRTFNNYDYENEHVVIAPHSPCPVLFGIRGDAREDLPDAMRMIRSEPVDRWLLFETNQATDDHVRLSGEPRPRTTMRLSGTVRAPPRVLPGGHVVVRVSEFDATVYEPAKQLRSVARALAPGDRVQIIGSLRENPLTINVEKLSVDDVASVRIKLENPTCHACGKRMKSMGRESAFRCIRCGTKAPRSAARYTAVGRTVRTGSYEPPVSARRHLSKPLKRPLA